MARSSMTTPEAIARTKFSRLSVRGVNSPLESRARILHVITDLELGGAETKLCKLLGAADRSRFSAAIVSLRSGGELQKQIDDLAVPVFNLGVMGSLPGPLSIWRLLRAVWQFDPDLIHGWMCHGNLAAQVAASFARRKPSVLWSVHQSLYGFEYDKWTTASVIRFCARLSDLPVRIIYPSELSAAQHEAVGYDTRKRIVLDYGFDSETFRPSQQWRREIRSELGIANDTPLIGLVARYHPTKDHQTFLRAAALITKVFPQTQFILCGTHIDDRNQRLGALVCELVHLLGERRDVPRIMAALDIAASSSRAEGFPNVVGEAMSAGLPCVATNVSNVTTIIADTGRIVPAKDPVALAVALQELIAISPERRRALGAAARARIIERYSLELSVGRYEQVYENVLAEARAGTVQVRPPPGSESLALNPKPAPK